jgi:hypothetical protein
MAYILLAFQAPDARGGCVDGVEPKLSIPIPPGKKSKRQTCGAAAGGALLVRALLPGGPVADDWSISGSSSGSNGGGSPDQT